MSVADGLDSDGLPVGHDGVGRYRRKFFSKVVQTPSCWVWTDKPSGSGYGQFNMPGKKRVMAHRYAYELLVGPIPEGLELDHLCRYKLCVNPSHLEPVTRSENQKRGKNGWMTHCKRGHELSGDNLLKTTDGRRACKLCKRRRYRDKYGK